MTFQPSLEWARMRIQNSISVKQALLESEELLSQIVRVTERMATALRNGNQILFFGNGGSAADAEHFAGELVGRFYRERRALPAQSLSATSAILTALGNDYGFDVVFARQIESCGRKGDVAFGISTSGNSPNVVRAFELARTLGLYTVALTGRSGGKLPGLADECICVPADETPRIQEAHQLIGHLICEGIESELFQS